MKHLRSKFEALPEIKKKLSMCEWSYSQFFDSYLVDDPCSGFINGAWEVFKGQYKIQQEQHNEILEKQHKIDTALNLLCKLQYSSGERIYKEVQEILE